MLSCVCPRCLRHVCLLAFRCCPQKCTLSSSLPRRLNNLKKQDEWQVTVFSVDINHYSCVLPLNPDIHPTAASEDVFMPCFLRLLGCPFSRRQKEKTMTCLIFKTPGSPFKKKENLPIHLLVRIYTVAKSGLTSVLLERTSWDPFFGDITRWVSSVSFYFDIWPKSHAFKIKFFNLLCLFLCAATSVQVLEAKLSLDALLQMTGAQVRDTMQRLGSSSEDCARLIAALSCLKSATESGTGRLLHASVMKRTTCILLGFCTVGVFWCGTGGELKEDGSSWLSEPTRRDSGSLLGADQLPNLGTPLRPHSPSPLACPSSIHSTPSTPCATFPHPRSGSVSAVPTPEALASFVHNNGPLTDPFPMPLARTARLHGRTSTPPITPPSKRRHRLKPPCTPPPPSRKVLHLLPNITLTRSKSHESQLGNRIEDLPASR